MIVDFVERREMLLLLDSLRAQVMAGNCSALEVCARDRAGHEQALSAGLYSRDLQEAVRASLRTTWKLTQLADAENAPPPLLKRVG